MGLEEELKEFEKDWYLKYGLEDFTWYEIYHSSLNILARDRNGEAVKALEGILKIANSLEGSEPSSEHLEETRYIIEYFIEKLIAFHGFVDFTGFNQFPEELKLSQQNKVLMFDRTNAPENRNERINEPTLRLLFSSVIYGNGSNERFRNGLIFSEISSMTNLKSSTIVELPNTRLRGRVDQTVDSVIFMNNRLGRLSTLQDSYVYINGNANLKSIRDSVVIYDSETKGRITMSGSSNYRLIVLNNEVEIVSDILMPNYDTIHTLKSGVYDITKTGQPPEIPQIKRVGDVPEKYKQHRTYEHSADELDGTPFYEFRDMVRGLVGDGKLVYHVLPTGHVFVSGVVRYEEPAHEENIDADRNTNETNVVPRNSEYDWEVTDLETPDNLNIISSPNEVVLVDGKQKVFRDLKQDGVLDDPEREGILKVIMDTWTERGSEHRLFYYGFRDSKVDDLPTGKELVSFYR